MGFNSQGIIIAFEGLDGSGKETQSRLLEKRLNNNGIKTIRMEFPEYFNKYSIFVKEYLKGDYGNEVDPYLVSMFFALDRFGIYKKKISKYLNEGYVILCDRYVYSNLIYQGSRFNDLKSRNDFFKWILDFEYNKCGLQKEDITFFMDVPVDISLNILESRTQKDINEQNKEFLRECYENSKYIVDKYNLANVNCLQNNKLLSVEEINNYLFDYIIKYLNSRG